MKCITVYLILLFQILSVRCFLYSAKTSLTPIKRSSPLIHSSTRRIDSNCRNDLLRVQAFNQYGDDIDPAYCSLTRKDILELIGRRTKARRARNFKLADEILQTLHQNNVFLHDEKKLWRADGETFDIRGYQEMEYRKSAQSRPISSREEEYVNQKLRERSKAKLRRDFDTADDILDELRFLKNVVVDDNRLTWRVAEPVKTEYTYGGRRLNNVRPEELQTIEQLVKQRSEAKDRKDFDVADDILDELKVIHGVRVDDSKKAWFFLPRFDDDLIESSENGDQEYDSNERATRKRKQLGKSQNRAKTTSESKTKVGKFAMPSGIMLSSDDVMNESETETASNESVQNADEESFRMVNYNQRYDDGVSESYPSTTIIGNDELEKCTVLMLKEKLRKAGLPVSGKKAELIERLRNKV
jgi:Cysteinyl-tRNA synthetase